MNGANRHVAPIFTKKKPRQALLAHPNNNISTNDSRGSYGPKTTYRQTNAFSRQTQNTSQASSGMNYGFQQNEQGNNLQRNAVNQNNGFNNSHQAQFNTPQQYSPFRQSIARPQSAPPQQSFPQQIQSVQHPYGNSNKFRAPRPHAPTPPSHHTQQSRQYEYGGGMQSNTWAPQPVDSNSMTYQSGMFREETKPAREMFGDQNKFGTSATFTSVGAGDGETWQQQQQQQAEQDVKGESKDFQIQKNGDSSLHFLTGTIQGAMHWSTYASKVPMIFEIFGILNSAVTNGNSHCAKQFILKDDKDSISCTYFKIDRELPGMVRGHWYRCVGRITSKEDGKKIFNCVSIRSATDVEKKMYKTQVNLSDKSMRNWVSKTREC